MFVFSHEERDCANLLGGSEGWREKERETSVLPRIWGRKEIRWKTRGVSGEADLSTTPVGQKGALMPPHRLFTEYIGSNCRNHRPVNERQHVCAAKPHPAAGADTHVVS